MTEEARRTAGRDVLAAIVEEREGPFALAPLKLEKPRADEVVIRVAGVGICHTDLVARDGIIPVPLPAVFGHEASGTIVEIGDAITNMAVGDKVVLTFQSCGACTPCTDHEPAYCDLMPLLNYTGRRRDGSSALARSGEPVSAHFFGQSSFATYALAHRSNVVRVETSLPLELLGPLGCGIQTGAGTVINIFRPAPSDSIAVFGGGSVGLSAILAAKALGCTRIALIDPVESRRSLATDLGATEVYDGADPEIAAAILGRGGPFDFVLDTSGVSAAIAVAIEVTAKRGTTALVAAPSVVGQTFPVRLGTFVQGGKVLRGVIEGDADPQSFIPQLLALHAEGRFPFERLIRTYPFDAINEAIDDQHEGRCVKPVLVMPGQAQA